MFHLNTIEQLFLFVEQLDQLEFCLPYSRLLTGIPILAVFQNLRWNSNNTSLPLILFASLFKGMTMTGVQLAAAGRQIVAQLTCQLLAD